MESARSFRSARRLLLYDDDPSTEAENPIPLCSRCGLFTIFVSAPTQGPRLKRERQYKGKRNKRQRMLHALFTGPRYSCTGGFPRRPPTLDDVRHTPNNNDNKDVKGSRRADAKRREKNIQFNKRGQRKTDENEIQGKQGPCPDPQLVELAERHGDGNSTPSIVHIYIPHYSALLGRRLTDGENWWTCTLRLLSLFNIFPRSPC